MVCGRNSRLAIKNDDSKTTSSGLRVRVRRDAELSSKWSTPRKSKNVPVKAAPTSVQAPDPGCHLATTVITADVQEQKGYCERDRPVVSGVPAMWPVMIRVSHDRIIRVCILKKEPRKMCL